MTLIEVLASLVILGTVLVTIVLAKGRFTHQSRASADRLIAVKAANRLLNQWWSKPNQLAKHFASPASGSLPHQMRWRTEFLPSPQLTALHARRVRLEILAPTPTPAPGSSPESTPGSDPGSDLTPENISGSGHGGAAASVSKVSPASGSGQVIAHVDIVVPIPAERKTGK